MRPSAMTEVALETALGRGTSGRSKVNIAKEKGRAGARMCSLHCCEAMGTALQLLQEEGLGQRLLLGRRLWLLGWSGWLQQAEPLG